MNEMSKLIRKEYITSFFILKLLKNQQDKSKMEI